MTRGQVSKCRQIATHSQRGIDWNNNLIDEIADVEIMIQQMMYIHDITADEINERVNFKLSRQIERMSGEG